MCAILFYNMIVCMKILEKKAIYISRKKHINHEKRVWSEIYTMLQFYSFISLLQKRDVLFIYKSRAEITIKSRFALHFAQVVNQ